MEWQKTLQYVVISREHEQQDPEGGVVARITVTIDRELPAHNGPTRFPRGLSWKRVCDEVRALFEPEVYGGYDFAGRENGVVEIGDWLEAETWDGAAGYVTRVS